jgi:peptidyl-prolyl cis-trans isomerase D
MAAKKGNKVILWGIVGLLFFGMVGFGATGLSGTVRTLGSVGDKDIALNDYARELNQQMRAYEAQIGAPLSFAEAQSIGLDQAVLAQMVARRALDNEAAQLGLSVGDERVREQILRISAFQGLSGQFDRLSYKSALERQGQSEAEFETALREEIARTLLQAAVVGGVPASPTYSTVLATYLGERRSVTRLVVDATYLNELVAEPTEADLIAYHAAHQAEFTRPETKEITYAWLTPDMLQDTVEIDETALRDLYQQRIGEYVQPERRLVERLAFGDQAAADAARAAIDSGAKDFDTLVADRGLDLSDVDMGDVSEDQLGAAGASAFAANPGDVVGPFASSFGPALFRVNAVLAAHEVSFEEARDDLRDELANSRARRMIDDQVGRVTDLLAGGATPEDLVNELGMALGTISYNIASEDGIAAYDSFRSAANAAKPGDYPALETLEDGGVFVLRVDSLREAEVLPLEEVIDEVRLGAWVEATHQAVLSAAEELAAGMDATTDPATLGLEPVTDAELTRRSFVAGTTTDYVSTIFQMQPGEVRVLDTGRQAILVRLDSVAPPDADDPALAAERVSIAEQVASGIVQDIFDAYVGVIQTGTEVKINQAAVNAVNANFQ